MTILVHILINIIIKKVLDSMGLFIQKWK